MSFARAQYDAVVVGSGPNGLSCAIRLMQHGLSVVLIERAQQIGGAARTEDLTLPGFRHDTFSAVHPMGFASPFFRSLPLEKHGLRWIHGPADLAHPFDDGSVALLKQSLDETAKALGQDEDRYRNAFDFFASQAQTLLPSLLEPLFKIPQHPLLMAGFGLKALKSARAFAQDSFTDDRTRALFLGIAAHACTDLSSTASAAIGLALTVASHSGGWPFPQGGAGELTSTLASYFISIGGEIVTSHDVRSLKDLPPSRHVFFDLTPRQILKIVDKNLPPRVRAGFQAFRYGPGVFKMDWALSEPVPWKNRDCAQAPTLHLGGSSEEIVRSEKDVSQGRHSEKPFMLVTQPSLFDSSRAPSGKHTLWAYCHVPNSSAQDMSALMEAQIERFAPGFRDTVLARKSLKPAQLEERNQNLIGGDISGGQVDIGQIIFRPRAGLNPYALDGKRLWICSSSTPPGPAVHGMCGFHAAERCLSS